MLYYAIHDPSMNVTEAFQTGFTRMIPVNANSITSINLGLVYRQNQDNKYAYDYGMSMSSNFISDFIDRGLAPTPSTINNMGLVCDTSAKDSYPCHLTLGIQMPTLGRTIIRRKKEMTWFVSRASLKAAPELY